MFDVTLIENPLQEEQQIDPAKINQLQLKDLLEISDLDEIESLIIELKQFLKIAEAKKFFWKQKN
ncbi:hypothetical protein HPY27_24060 [Brevibacillus sp. HB1.1]|uniref:hypothetical protein n=1 Tax=Brevibacillus sp. HB1.1 TaxID=2738808 RepID=UPI001576E4C6|nr:hypothetical protein [Brevibacillus sp. HB1.1]NTU33232.1 hypothetical protein [Brevibacillus sp. HB1.1]